MVQVWQSGFVICSCRMMEKRPMWVQRSILRVVCDNIMEKYQVEHARLAEDHGLVQRSLVDLKMSDPHCGSSGDGNILLDRHQEKHVWSVVFMLCLCSCRIFLSLSYLNLTWTRSCERLFVSATSGTHCGRKRTLYSILLHRLTAIICHLITAYLVGHPFVTCVRKECGCKFCIRWHWYDGYRVRIRSHFFRLIESHSLLSNRLQQTVREDYQL